MAHEGKSSRSTIVKVVAVAVAVVALTGAQKSCQTSTQSRSSTAKVESTADSNGKSSAVVYSVTSDARIKSVSYLDADGNMVTRTDVGSSWSSSGPSDHGTVLISATTSDGSSMIKCSVKVRGKVVQRASAVGDGSTTVVCRSSY